MARKQTQAAAARKPNFEVVAKSEILSLREAAPQPQRILSLSNDSSLARTREMLFVGAGFQVSTYMNTALAIQACRRESFDLIVIGHSIPLIERRNLLKEVRSLCDTPILAMLRHGEAPLPGADYMFDSSQNPAHLLEMVIHILGRPQASAVL